MQRNIFSYILILISLLILIFFELIIENKFWFFLISYCSGFLGFNKLISKNDLDIFRPYFGFCILLFLYSSASISYVEQNNGTGIYGDTFSIDIINIYYQACIIGIWGIMVGTLIASKFKKVKIFQIEPQLNSNIITRLIFWSIFLFICFPLNVLDKINFLNVKSYAENALEVRLERMSTNDGGIRDVFSTTPLTVILVTCVVVYFNKYNKIYKFLASSVFLSFLTYNFLAGWRGALVSAILIPVFYYNYKVKKINLRYALPACILIYLLINTMSLIRSTSNPFEMISLLLETTEVDGFAFLKFSNSGELLTGMNLLKNIDGIQKGQTEYTYGMSIVSELLVYIPRSLFPARPLPLSEKFVEVFYPGVRDSGGGYGFFCLQEGYWALGLSGVLIFMFFYGLIIERIYSWFLNNRQHSFALILYPIIYSSIVMAAVRSGLIGNFKAVGIAILPILIFALIPIPKLKFKF